MERVQPQTSVTAPVCALALAVGAGASFAVGDAVGFLSDTAEDLFIVTWLLGWLLVGCAATVGGGYAIVLTLRWHSRQTVSRSESLLCAAALAVITFVVASHPLWGTGSAVGG